MKNERSTPKLLVIDDDKALRGLLRCELGGTYEVIDTGEPETGLALALEHRPSAILLDLRMPVYSGYQLCERFKSVSLTQQIPVVIISGEAGAETNEFCREIGAVACFQKPVDFQALKTRLSEIAVPRPHVSRSEARIPLHVQLRLRGNDALGHEFEDEATTEDVSTSGFFCTSATQICVHSVVEVYASAAQNKYIGKAEIVRAEAHLASLWRYGCRFVEKTGLWVLQ